MPDPNKLKVFEQTKMTLFKGCVLCKHGEIPANTTWGYCKHTGHFYTHGKHGRLPGSSHAAMGCDDFQMKHVTHRDMIELGPYLELVPVYDAAVEEVGVEQEPMPEKPVDILRWVLESIQMEKLDIPDDVLASMRLLSGNDTPKDKEPPPVEMEFKGSKGNGESKDKQDAVTKVEKPAKESPEKTVPDIETLPKTGTGTNAYVNKAPAPEEKPAASSTPASKEPVVASSSPPAKSSRSSKTSSSKKSSSKRRSKKTTSSTTPEQMVKEEAAGHAMSYQPSTPPPAEAKSPLKEDSP